MFSASILIAFSVGILLKILAWLFSRPKNLPPGPWSFPVIGYRFGPGLIHECFADLARQYGPVFSVRRGPALMVVLNDADSIREAMVKNADAFSDHFVPGPMKWSLPKSNKNASIACANGKAYTELMRFCLPALRSFGFGKKSLAPRINLEAQYMSEEIARLKSAPFSPVHTLNMATANIVCQLVFGQRFEYDDAEFLHILRSMCDMVNVSESDPVIVFPFLMKTPWYKNRRQTYYDLYEFIMAQLRVHRETFQKDNIRDFIDAYMADEDISRAFTLDEFWRIVLDLFAGGTETTAAFLSWVLLFMAVHPEIQKKAQAELDSVVGRGRQPTLDDQANLPFCEAIVLEVLRIRPILPVALPHLTSKQVSIRGHSIPKDTLIIPNVWGAHHDAEAWKDPDVFDPERFLENGSVKKNNAWVVFGSGRRECPGAQLAKMEGFLFFTNLVQRFEFKLPADQSEVSLQGRNGLTMWPQPYNVCAFVR